MNAKNKFPMPYSNPYMMDGKRAPFAIAGREPDNKGGGILFWAYDVDERDVAVKAFKEAGYHNIHWENCSEA